MLLGLLALVRAAVELSEAEVAVGDEYTRLMARLFDGTEQLVAVSVIP